MCLRRTPCPGGRPTTTAMGRSESGLARTRLRSQLRRQSRSDPVSEAAVRRAMCVASAGAAVQCWLTLGEHSNEVLCARGWEDRPDGEPLSSGAHGV